MAYKKENFVLSLSPEEIEIYSDKNGNNNSNCKNNGKNNINNNNHSNINTTQIQSRVLTFDEFQRSHNHEYYNKEMNNSNNSNNFNNSSSSNNVYYSTFGAMITPMTELTPLVNGENGLVEFRLMKKCNSVTLQWEPFEGSVSNSGVACININQSIMFLPPYQIDIPIIIALKGERKQTFIRIDPKAPKYHAKIFLDISGIGTNVNKDDHLYVPAGSATWLL